MTNNLFQSLKQHTKNGQIVVIHSSISGLLPQKSPKRDFLLALLTLSDQCNITFAIPTFTFSFTKTKHYHFLDTRSETGLLGEWVLSLPQAIRSCHPIYSFALLGNKKFELDACLNTTTFSKDSIFSYFEQENARIIMFGCDWAFCTQAHYYEEKYQVPYREYKTFTGDANFGREKEHVNCKMFVRNLTINAQNNIAQIGTILDKKKQLTITPFMRSNIQSSDCRYIAQACNELLSKDTWNLVRHKPLKKFTANNQVNKQKLPTLNIAMVGISNLAPLESSLKHNLTQLFYNQNIKTYTSPTSQLHSIINNQQSDLYQFSPDITFIVNSLDDIYDYHLDGLPDLHEIEKKLSTFLSSIQQFATTNNKKIFLHTFEALYNYPEITANGEPFNIDALTQKINQKLEDTLKKHGHITIIETKKLLRHSRSAPFDLRLKLLGRFHFSDKFSQQLAQYYATISAQTFGKSIRLIITDLDNTLWGGVLGEDGIENLKIKGDFPNNAFQAFQLALKEYKLNGIPLAIASKNNEADIIELFKAIPMPLTLDDFVAKKINWRPKWQNIIEISTQIGIGLENILFIDDSEIECALTRENLPALNILKLTTDPVNNIEQLQSYPLLQKNKHTDTELSRTQSYAAKEKLDHDLKNAHNISDFIRTLNLSITLESLNITNAQRIEQLLHKTNQFNTTGEKYTTSELRLLQENNHLILAVHISDNYFSSEIMGALIISMNTETKNCLINNYVFSCRALGKKAEQLTLEALMLFLSSNTDYTSITGIIKKLSRNVPARKIYQHLNFTQLDDATWSLDLQKKICQSYPCTIKYQIKLNKQRVSI